MGFRCAIKCVGSILQGACPEGKRADELSWVVFGG